jgi:hypothetical protein
MDVFPGNWTKKETPGSRRTMATGRSAVFTHGASRHHGAYPDNRQA